VVRQRSREQLYSEGKAIPAPAKSRGLEASGGPFRPHRDLEASNKGRLPELIPIRYGRMIQSPFVFFAVQRVMRKA